MSQAVADAFTVAVRADLLGARQLLASLQRDDRVPRLILEALIAQHQGENPRAIELFKRAFRRAESADKLYVADLLAPLLAPRTAPEAYEEIMSGLTPQERERPSICAVQAMRAAMHSDFDESRQAAKSALERLGECSPLERARTLSRLAYAAYYRGDFAEAVDSAQESAANFVDMGNYSAAFRSYSILYSVHYSASGDFAEALRVAGCMTEFARRSNDVSLEMVSLVAEYELSAELAEETRFYQLQRIIRARPLSEQYAERFARGVADALAFGWTGDFDALRANAVILRDQVADTLRERALCHALRSLAEAAVGEREEASRAARTAIEMASLPSVREPAYQGRYRRLARGLAAGTCVLIGDTVRGRRALAARGLRDSSDARSLLEVAEGARWQDAYPSVRGYARIVALVRERVISSQRTSALTPTELSVLRMLAEGMSAPQIGQATGRSVHTIHAHTRAIIAKLGVKGRVAAINQARKAGLIP